MHEDDRAGDAIYRAAFDDAPIGLIVTDIAVDASGSGRIVEVNPAMEAMLGQRREELVGRTVDDITAPDDRWLVRDPAEGSARRIEKRYLRGDGSMLWVEVSSAYIRGSDGAPVAVIRHVEDITVRKQSEQALLDALETQRRATAQLGEVERVREELMRTVTHELRTPLTSIYAHLEMLLEDTSKPGLAERHQEMLRVSLRNAARLSALLDELNEEATAQAPEIGALAPDVSIVRFDKLVSGALDAVDPVVTRNGQELRRPAEVPDVLLTGDYEQLHRVFINVLANAAKFTPTGGRISVRTGTDGARAWAEVSDTGIGIPQDELGRLFERDYRASTAQRNRIHGSGLGLAIAKTIVDHHGGSITVHSEPGVGSVFTVYLPMTEHEGG